MASRKRSISKDEDMRALYKELDEVSCPICMEYPHNAILLLCSSHDKGCRSYICDTSYRHSNCLDRYRRLKAESGKTSSPPSLLSRNQHDAANTSSSNLGFSSSNELIGTHENHEGTETLIATSMGLPRGSGGNTVHSVEDSMLERVGGQESSLQNSSEVKLSLSCPLCRGSVLGWKVVEEARKYLNLKPRSCSHESCSFFSNYRELRWHARRVHPTARPAEVHPSRERAWRHLEDEHEYDDIVSAIRSAMPGAMVLGDYVIENGDMLLSERERGPGDNRRWLSTFFLFQMIDSMDRGAELRDGRSRALSRHRRSTGAFPRRRYLWGENLLGLQDEDNDDDNDEDDDDDEEPDLNILSDMVENDSSLGSRRRRRLTRSGSDEDQP